ncbi:MAG: GNAT family N-acetyltransferase [Pseudomonadota bacterium]
MTTPPTLTTDRLTLCPLGPQHFAPVRAFYASPRSRFVGGPQNEDQAWRTLAAEIGHWTLRGYGRWAIELTATGEMVAMIGAWNPEGWPEPEIGWDVMNGHEGHGYATEAGRAARDWLYEVKGWTTAISLIADGNHGSEGVAKRLGAVEERKFTHVTFGPMAIWRHPAKGAP